MSLKPMEAAPIDELPRGGNWLQPKYDGFRCIALRDGDQIKYSVEETEIALP